MELIEQMFRSPVIGDRTAHVVRSAQDVDIDGEWLEFGVASGWTINRLAEICAPKIVHGFDSFEGLPEDWQLTKDTIQKKGTFAKPELPRVFKNVRLIVGMFDETLPGWLEQQKNHFALVHVDCDLYSSTSTIFSLCNDRIVPGTVIRFDDIAHWASYSSQDEDALYANWAEGEYKALIEWLETYDRSVEVLHRADRWGATVKVTN